MVQGAVIGPCKQIEGPLCSVGHPRYVSYYDDCFHHSEIILDASREGSVRFEGGLEKTTLQRSCEAALSKATATLGMV